MAVTQRGVIRSAVVLAISALVLLLMFSQGGTKFDFSPKGEQENVLHNRKPLDYMPQADKTPVQRQSENAQQYQARLAEQHSLTGSAKKPLGPASPGSIPKAPLGSRNEPPSLKSGNSQINTQNSQKTYKGEAPQTAIPGAVVPNKVVGATSIPHQQQQGQQVVQQKQQHQQQPVDKPVKKRDPPQVGNTKEQPLVGENWDKPDPKNLPNVITVNLDNPSLARRGSDTETEDKRLIPGLVPSIVHFVWCRKRWFEFKPYLSIQSAIRFIKPDKVVFHYEFEPDQDKLYYHQWIADLEHDFPFFVKRRMTDYDTRVCYGTREAQMSWILDTLRFEGGIYVGESTWILDFPATKLEVDLELALEPNGIDGYVILRAGIVPYNNQTLDSLASSLARTGSYKVKYQQCASVNQLYNGLKNPHCMIVKGGVFDSFYPSDIWELKHRFGGIVRKIFYGTEEILKPKPSYDTLVPNIGHMIWLGGGPMNFVFYLSVLSMLYVVEVDTLYIHGDLPPAGPYWQKLMNNQKVRPRLKFITRPQPLMVYQGVIEPYFKALMSDVIRVDIMIKYGGIYADTDAIWVKPLTKEDRGYDAVASYDWVDWSYPYPDSVNFGLSYGKKNAPFWRIFRESMRKLHNDVHGFTGVMMPYKVLEKYPHLLRIDRHLQVICYQYRCHPTWVPNYHNMSIDHVTTGSLKNWRQDVNAIHWTHPDPPELGNETALAAGSGLFADLGRMVLSKAGIQL